MQLGRCNQVLMVNWKYAFFQGGGSEVPISNIHNDVLWSGAFKIHITHGTNKHNIHILIAVYETKDTTKQSNCCASTNIRHVFISLILK